MASVGRRGEMRWGYNLLNEDTVLLLLFSLGLFSCTDFLPYANLCHSSTKIPIFLASSAAYPFSFWQSGTGLGLLPLLLVTYVVNFVIHI